MRRAIVAAMMLILSVPVEAQAQLVLAGDPAATLTWTHVFASPGNDWINDIVPISGDRYLAVGFLDRGEASDWRALAAALRPDGSLAFQREYGAGGGVDAFWTARETGDGGLVYAGFTGRIGGAGLNGYAVFTDGAGTIRKEAAFGGDGYDRFTGLAAAPDGYVFAGHSQSAGEGAGRRRLYIVKTDPTGAPIWERIIDGADELGGLYVEQSGDGGFIVSGGLGHGEGPTEDRDIFVIKIDAEGHELWRRTVGTPHADDINHGLVVLPGGSIVVVGYSNSWGARDHGVLAATLSPGGEILRRELMDGAGDDRPILAKADSLGRVLIAGYTRSGPAGGWDVLMARLDAAGRFEPGVLTLGSAQDDNGTAIRAIGGDSFLVAGYSVALGTGSEDAFVARIDGARFALANPAFTRKPIAPGD